MTHYVDRPTVVTHHVDQPSRLPPRGPLGGRPGDPLGTQQGDNVPFYALRFMVLPYWNGMETNMEGFLTDEVKFNLVARVQDMVTDMLAPVDAKRKPKPSLQTKHLSSRAHGVALDLQLQSITSVNGMNHFLSDVRCQLKPGDSRFYVDLEDLPDEMKAASEGYSRRSCIEDDKGQTRLEVIWSSRPILCMAGDMGASAWKPKTKYVYSFGVRGTERHDAPHRTVRNRLLAISRAGGNFVKYEYDTLFAWMSGPWGSGGNGQLVKQAATEISKNFTHLDFPLFDLLYERLTLCYHQGRVPTEFGTEAHRQHI